MGALTRDATVPTTGGGGGGRHARRRSKSRRRHSSSMRRSVGRRRSPTRGVSQYVCLIGVKGFVRFAFITAFLCILRSHTFVNHRCTIFSRRYRFLDVGWLDG